MILGRPSPRFKNLMEKSRFCKKNNNDLFFLKKVEKLLLQVYKL